MKNFVAAFAVLCLFCVAPLLAQSAATLESVNRQTYHTVSQSEAKALIARYQSVNPFQTWAFHAGTLPSAMIQALLSQEGAMFLGYYYSIDASGKPQILFVAKNAKVDDILSSPNGIITPHYINAAQDISSANIITESQARAWIENLKSHSAYATLGKLGGAMFREAVLKLCHQNQAVRVYFALDTRNEPHVVLIGTNQSGTEESTTLMLDRDICPPVCNGGGGGLGK